MDENNYNSNIRSNLIQNVKAIIEDQVKLNNCKEHLAEDLKTELINILNNITIDSLNEKNEDELKDIILRYNIVANKAWVRYIDGKMNFLIYTTELSSMGEKLKSESLTTHLISIPDYTVPYGTYKYAYVINARHINRIDCDEEYENKIVKLPQLVREESVNNNKMFDIILDEFKLEAVIISNGTSYIDAQKLSNLQKWIPIKCTTPEGLILAEDYFKQKAYKNKLVYEIKDFEYTLDESFRIISNKQKELNTFYVALKLNNNLTDYTEMHNMINDVISNIQTIDMSKTEVLVKLTEIVKIYKKFHIEDVFKRCVSIEESKYIQALGEKIQDFIVQAQKTVFDNQINVIKNENISKLFGMLGKEKLRTEMIRNLELKKQLTVPEYKFYRNREDTMIDLHNYAMENGINKDIIKYLNEYRCEIDDLTEEELLVIKNIITTQKIDPTLKVQSIEMLDMTRTKQKIEFLQKENEELAEKLNNLKVKKSDWDKYWLKVYTEKVEEFCDNVNKCINS